MVSVIVKYVYNIIHCTKLKVTISTCILLSITLLIYIYYNIPNNEYM